MNDRFKGTLTLKNLAINRVGAQLAQRTADRLAHTITRSADRFRACSYATRTAVIDLRAFGRPLTSGSRQACRKFSGIPRVEPPTVLNSP